MHSLWLMKILMWMEMKVLTEWSTIIKSLCTSVCKNIQQVSQQMTAENDNCSAV